MTMLYRQGDILILATDAIPADTRPVPRDHGRIVLAYGEATGHAHAITAAGATLLALTDDEVTDRFLRIVDAEAQLTHEEHATITLPPGDYIVRRQREYTPTSLEWVAD